MTKYPIYVPSKGRADVMTTPHVLDRSELDYTVVVEPTEYDDYARQIGSERLLLLDARDQGLPYARNSIKNHAMALGHERHWCLDDNIKGFLQWDAGDRVPVKAGDALYTMEFFVDAYTNVAIAGPMHHVFGYDISTPFAINQQVYSCVLVRSDQYRWRGRAGHDTDYSLQVLTDGWCTVLFRAIQQEKETSGVMAGGNTDEYWDDDGRLKRARDLQKRWPNLGRIERRTGRPNYNLSQVWRKFPQQLIRKKE